MKSLAITMSFLTSPQRRRNFWILIRLLFFFFILVALYTVIFHVLMAWEGQEHSWLTGLYWTFVVMSTLGFGDITFQSDLGRLFSIIVLVTGTVYMLVLLPFMFIQFLYVPWMEAQSAARAPRELPKNQKGHVILTNLGPVEMALIRRLNQSHIPYVVIVPDLTEALNHHDQGYRVMVGDLDDPQTYVAARADQAALVVANRTDTSNTNIVFTVREGASHVAIVATASSTASVDILELAGSNQVLQLGKILGQAMARRVLGRDAKSHVIGEFGDLMIAEAAASNTPLVGKTLREIGLRQHAPVNVVGVWDRGKFQIAGPETQIKESSVLILAGTREQLTVYDGLFCIYKASEAPVVIIGGGRVGRAAAQSFTTQGVEYRIVEKLPERVRQPADYVVGDAADLEVLEKAGIRQSSSVLVTTHDDDVNVYLTIYCRRLRPDIQILARANQERNVSTLHRAGADFVLSYATTGASILYNLLQRTDILLLAEGLDVFRTPVPRALVGKSLAESGIRSDTGCHVIAVVEGDRFDANPAAHEPLPADGELVLIGSIESENLFLTRYGAA